MNLHQLVVLHDGSTGLLRAVSVGSLLGQLRTGGLAGTEVFMLQRLAAQWGVAAEAGSVGRALDTTHIEQQGK